MRSGRVTTNANDNNLQALRLGRVLGSVWLPLPPCLGAMDLDFDDCECQAPPPGRSGPFDAGVVVTTPVRKGSAAKNALTTLFPTPAAEPGKFKSSSARKRRLRLHRFTAKGGELDRHLASCADENCLRCRYANMRKKWEQRLPFAPLDMNIDATMVKPDKVPLLSASWLAGRTDDDDGFRVGCIACAPTSSCVFGRFQAASVEACQISNLLKHQASKVHRGNVLTTLGLDVGPSGKPTVTAPPAPDFMAVWDAAERGSVGEGVSHVGGHHKCKKIVWCLAEAIKRLDQEFVAGATTMAIHRDASGGCLLVRFVAANASLQVRRGIFGLAKNFGSSASEITAATSKLFVSFATQNLGAPPRRHCDKDDAGETVAAAAAQPQHFRSLEDHARSILHMVNVDSASDELLSCAQMLGRAGEDMDQMNSQLFPKLEAVVRDKPHGQRRILSRPWQADPFLDELTYKILLNRNSIIQRIEHSDLFKQAFRENCIQMEGGLGREISNLRASKHRFESYSKPMGRFILWLDAVLATAEHISVKRRGNVEGRDAETFLEYVDAEKILQIAMMSDAADESMGLLRYVDDEEYDKAMVPDVVRRFLDAAILLFEQGQCTTLTGFTRYAMDRLRAVKIVFVRGEPKTIGGPGHPTETCVQTCLQRMTCWLRLAISVVKTEWPSWELLAAFSCLNLAMKTSRSLPPPHDGDEEPSRDVQKLAMAFKVDAQQLDAQLRDLRPLALKAFASRQCTTAEAWAEALRQTQGRSDKRRSHPADAATPVLARFAAFGGSTSGIEQNFAVRLRLLVHREQMTAAADSCVLKVALERHPADEARVIGMAREIWVDSFGGCSASPSEKRVHKGLPQASAKKHAGTETEFLTKRRRGVGEAVDRTSKAGGLKTMEEIMETQPEGWEPRHQQEEDFQKAKRRRIQVEAYQDGHLLADEIDPALRAETAAAALEAKRNAKDRAAKRRFAEAILNQHGTHRLADMRGTTVFIENRADLELRMRADEALLTEATDRLSAALFIAAEDPTELGQRTKWAAALTGGLVTVRDFVVGGNNKSTFPIVKYKKACLVHKEIFMTEAFQQKHTEISKMIAGATQLPGSKWSLITTKEAFVVRFAKACRSHRGPNIIALITSDEQRHGFPPTARVLPASSFLELVRRIDVSQSARGFCKR